MPKVLIIFLSALSFNVMAEIWFEIEEDGSAIECPDVLVIDGSSYEILNDCYGLDRRHPLIESGSILIKNETVDFVGREVLHATFIGSGENDESFVRSSAGGGVILLKNGPKVFYFRVNECSDESC